MNKAFMKIKTILIFLFFSTSLFAQKYFIKQEKDDGVDLYMDIIGVYDSLSLPYFIRKDTSAVKMISSHYNILILRLKDAIIHYDVLTHKKDTLFYVYHDTEISQPVWSRRNDKVAFAIYNPSLKYGYKTPYRFIVLTLKNGKVIKKEKFNIDDFLYEFLGIEDSILFFKNNSTLAYEDNSSKIHYLELTHMSGSEPIKKGFDYLPSFRKGYIYKCKYFYRNIPELNHYFILNRYYLEQGKIVDLKNKDSITWQVPQIKDKELQYLTNYAVTPDKSKLAVFMISEHSVDNHFGGYFLIFEIPNLNQEKKLYVDDIVIRSLCSYFVDFDFKNNNTICYEIFDYNKEDFAKKCITIK